MSKEGIASALKAVDLFSSLGDADLMAVASRAKVQRYQRGQVMLSERETSQYMYCVLKGMVKAFRVSDEGKETILAMHGEGRYFGDLSLIDGKTAPAAVAAMEESTVALISKDDFFDMLFTERAVLTTVLTQFSSRLREAWQRIQILHFRDAALRVRMLLMTLLDDNGRDAPDGSRILDMRLTHQSIADLSGLTRETVTRVLDRWRKDGDLDFDENRRIRLSRDFFKKTMEM